MKLKSVNDLKDIKTLISCLYTIGDIEEENFADCVSEPELGVLCDILEEKGKVDSAADLYDSARNSYVHTAVGAVFDAMGLDVDEEDKVYVYLWALGLLKTPSKINETFDDISTFGGVEGISADEDWEGTWDEMYETLITDAELRECEDWLNNPSAPIPCKAPSVGRTVPSAAVPPVEDDDDEDDEEEEEEEDEDDDDFPPSAPSGPKPPPCRPKSSFKIKF